jgi:AraC-like DNA-binding protein
MVLINYPGLDAATRRASGLHGGFGIHDGGLLADTLKLAAPDETGAVVLPAERLLPLLNALAEYGKQAPRSAARHTRAQRQSIVNRARAFLDSHIEQRVTLAALARASGASPFHLSRIFHQLTRQSIKDYVAERRTFRAKQLLSNGQLNVGQVARELGFSTVSYFSRFFKLHAGVTPTEYARRLTG